MSALVSRSRCPARSGAAAIAPTIVTSSPSRIQTVPSPITIRQWKRDHGSRSSRAGMFVRILRGSAPASLTALIASVSLRRVCGCSVARDAALPRARSSLPLLERGRNDALAMPARLRSGRHQRYETADEASVYAHAFDREDREDLGRRAPLFGLFPLRLLRALRGRGRRS